MKKFAFLIVLSIIFSLHSVVSQDLDEILDNYFETVGQEAFNKVEDFALKGKSIMQGMENDFLLKQKRPDKLYLEVDIQGMKLLQAYDGKVGWMVAPWTGTTEPQDITGLDLKSLKEQAEMDDRLFNWEEKGHKAELLGKEDMEGTEVFKIKLIDDEGDEYTFFIDSENYVQLKSISKLKFGDQTVESEMYFSNYEVIEGIAFPFSIESRMSGQIVSQINIEEVKINVGVDDSIFEKPKKPVEKQP